MGHKFDPEKIERLVSEERAREMDPEGLLRRFGLRPGQTFVDVGSGPGFFSIPASRIVGEGGRVYAVDTEERMLDHLRRRNPPANVVPLKSAENSMPLPDASADFVLLAFVLHEAEDAARFLAELKRILKGGGTLLLIDWKKQPEEKGPPVEERIEAEDARRLVSAAGFKEAEAGSLNASHYAIRALA